jgi:hypothetical protein
MATFHPYKLYACDVGLLRRLSGLAPSAFAEGTHLFTEFKGSFSENYLLEATRPGLRDYFIGDHSPAARSVFLCPPV